MQRRSKEEYDNDTIVGGSAGSQRLVWQGAEPANGGRVLGGRERRRMEVDREQEEVGSNRKSGRSNRRCSGNAGESFRRGTLSIKALGGESLLCKSEVAAGVRYVCMCVTRIACPGIED